MRKNTWKTKVEKQVVRSLFLAKHLLKTKPEDPAVEKLLNRLNTENSIAESASAQSTETTQQNDSK